MIEKPKRVREQVVVYLDGRDQTLLAQMVDATGLPKTELFRRGLRQLAQAAISEKPVGGAFSYLAESATDDGFPPDVAARHDHYLYDGGYRAPVKKKRAPVR